MTLKQRLKRWRALRGVPPLTAASREGTLVRASGIARAGKYAEPFIPPLAGVPCVVAWSSFYAGNQGNPRNPALQIERLLLRPFLLETGELDVIVDASHVELLLPMTSEGNAREISVRDGAAITVIGTVLRDGIEIPTDELVFRDTQAAYKLVGNKRYPVVITASVSDMPAR